jgi:hypothetical protein
MGQDWRAKIAACQHPRRSKPLVIDAEIHKSRTSDRKLLRQARGFQKGIALRADKSEQSFAASSRRRLDKLVMNPNRP